MRKVSLYLIVGIISFCFSGSSHAEEIYHLGIGTSLSTTPFANSYESTSNFIPIPFIGGDIQYNSTEIPFLLVEFPDQEYSLRIGVNTTSIFRKETTKVYPSSTQEIRYKTIFDLTALSLYVAYQKEHHPYDSLAIYYLAGPILTESVHTQSDSVETINRNSSGNVANKSITSPTREFSYDYGLGAMVGIGGSYDTTTTGKVAFDLIAFFRRTGFTIQNDSNINVGTLQLRLSYLTSFE